MDVRGKSIPYWLFLFIFSLLLLELGRGKPTSANPTNPTAVNYAHDQIVVRLESDVSVDAVNAVYGTTTIKTLPGSMNIYLLQSSSTAVAIQTVTAMNSDPDVLYAELNLVTALPEASGRDTYGWPDGNVQTTQTTTGGQTTEPDPRVLFGWELSSSDGAQYYNQPAVHSIDLGQAHILSEGSNVVVAVLDTGVDSAHMLLAGHLSQNGYDFIDGDSLPRDDFNGFDDDGDGFVDEAAGHGTHIAGLIHLVAPQAQIMPLRVLDTDGQGNSFIIAEAMLYASQQGAGVINLSLGTTVASQFLEDVVEQVAAGGVVVVGAAGNLNQDTPQYPAAFSCSLAVTAIGPGLQKAAYANHGEWVDLVGPGEHIYSTYPGSAFAYWNGTSMATPLVAGQVALIRSLQPWLTPGEIGRLIAGTAHSVEQMNPDYQGELGAGLIDIYTSLELIDTTWPAGTPDPFQNCTLPD